MIDHKQLAKIAKACRKAGITHYECAEFKITVSLDEPIKIKRVDPKGNKIENLAPDKLKTEELSEESLLLWSATGGLPIEGIS